MKDVIILFIKGFFVGVAKILPGISGSFLAISLGIYEKSIIAIRYFFNDVKNNFKFLFPILIGVLIALVYTSKLVLYLFDNYYFITMVIFIILILKQIKINNQKYFFISFILGLSLLFIDSNQVVLNSPLKLILVGIIDAFSMVIPGLSGTFLMMILGVYDKFIYTISDLTNLNHLVININILIPILIGDFIGIIGSVLLMNYLLKRFSNVTYSVINGLALSNVLVMIIKMF